MIKFRKIFEKNEEGEAINSIITYFERPYFRLNNKTSYMRMIRIDCLLFVFEYTWFSELI